MKDEKCIQHRNQVSKGKTILEDVFVEWRILSKEAVRKYVGFIPADKT